MKIHTDKLREILLGIGEQVEGNLFCDIHPDNVLVEENSKKIHNLQYLVKGKRRICEIGVNAGHSLLMMLEANPTAEYVLFDIGIHKYTRPCVEYIQSQFPDASIQIVYGDSKQTVSEWNGEFDIIHVDGGHDIPEMTSDYNQSMRLIAKNGVIVFDDYSNYSHIQAFLDEKQRAGEIHIYEDSNIQHTNQHLIFTNPLKV